MTQSETRNKIIEATIECIEEEGIQDVTVRKIAEKAQVNVAAVNYHFSSKSNLLRETLNTTLDNLFLDWEELLKKEDFNVRESLTFILNEMLSGPYRFPNITKAHIYDGFIHGNYDNDFFSRFAKFLNKLLGKLEENNPGKTDQMKIAIIQLFSAAVTPSLLPGLYQAFPDQDLSDPNKQQDYIRILIDHYIGDFTS